jgi:hypothetical protein
VALDLQTQGGADIPYEEPAAEEPAPVDGDGAPPA